ncbi:pectate lyase [Parabacteroides sp. OttesenSCG-928-G06]|nr:pectate lyase [Parabacteroides sp. OttesenSCG-928-G06]
MHVVVSAQTPAFPGAEGFGRFTSGGRGGEVYRVTTLEDNAPGEPMIPGSLRQALAHKGPKTILFDVSGTIELKQELGTGKDNLTLAGQSAPGDGICLSGYGFRVNSDNVIIRFMRFRPGDASRKEPDALGGMDGKDVIIDHCSSSWSVDECLSVYGMENLTVQWCIASEALRLSTHSKSAHGYGGNWGGNKASYHHNLIAHCESRVPRLGPRKTTQLHEYVDIRNNLFYNWAGNGCYGGEAMQINLVNNYYKPGPATDKASSKVKYRIARIGVRTEEYIKEFPEFAPTKHIWGKYFIDGNKMEGNKEVTADNWTLGVYAQTSAAETDNLWTQATRDSIRLELALAVEPVTTHTADQAYKLVMDYAGCCLKRDEIDKRIIADVKNRKASFSVAGNKPGHINSPYDTRPAKAGADWSPWPLLHTANLPVDTDGDGMPDYWEEANGLDKNNPADGKACNAEGYSWLEVYLNSLVEDIVSRQNGTR